MLNTPNSALWLKVLSGAASLMGASLFLSLPALAELEDSKLESLSSGAAEMETTDTDAVESTAADAIKPEATGEMDEVTGYEVVDPAAATEAELDADVTAEVGTEADAEMTGVEPINTAEDAADAEVDAEVDTEVSTEADTETELDANLEPSATEENTVELDAAESSEPSSELEAGVEAETDAEAGLEAAEPSVPSVESDTAATEEPAADTFDLNADEASESIEPEAAVEAEDLNSSSGFSSGDAIAEDISDTTMPEAMPEATETMEPAPAAPAPMGTETESEVEPSADALTETGEDATGLETSVEPEELQQFASAIPVLQSLEQSAREEVDAVITGAGLTPQRFTELYQAQAEGTAPVTEATPEEQASFESLISQIETIESETLSDQNAAIRAEGLEPERFTEIMAMVQQNPTLQEQVIQMMQPAPAAQ